jgi:hypothetical protein
MSYQCAGCGTNDFTTLNWNNDLLENPAVCTACGWVDRDIDTEKYLSFFTAYVESIHPESLQEDKRKRSKNRTARRNAHVNERLSQAINREPRICPEHVEIIRDAHEKYRTRNYFYNRRSLNGCLNKTDVAKLLRWIDNNYRGLVKKKFSQLYLEKWKSIIVEILQCERFVLTERMVIAIGTEFMKYSTFWNRLVAAGRIPENRVHFPNYNFMFCQIARELGYKIPVSEFPYPRTKSCVQELTKYFLMMRNLMYPEMAPTNYIQLQLKGAGKKCGPWRVKKPFEKKKYRQLTLKF